MPKKGNSINTSKGMTSKQGQLRTAGRKSSSISKMGVTGVYGANPSPSLSEYKQSMGPDTIPLKFAETKGDGIGSAKRQTNAMRTNVTDRKKAPAISGATIMKGKNRYRTVAGSGLDKVRGKI